MKEFEKVKLRLDMVNYAVQHDISAAAKHFNTSRKTIHKWKARFKNLGMKGLYDQSRKPHSSPDTLSAAKISKVIEIKKKFGNISTKRLAKMELLPCCHETARKHLKLNGYGRGARVKKYVAKRSLREIKEQWDVFEEVVVDTKYLWDMPNYFKYMKYYGLPRYQYTARDVKSGLLFTAYSNQISLAHSKLFVRTIVEFLNRNGIDTRKTTFQYDNGPEYVACVRAKGISKMEQALKELGVGFQRIPVGKWSYNADVETVHSIMEYEFFEIEPFNNREMFFEKASCYCLYFNNLRQNSNRNDKTPSDYLQEAGLSKYLSLWTPIDLDKVLGIECDIIAKRQATYSQKIFVDYLDSLCNNLLSHSVNHVYWNHFWVIPGPGTARFDIIGLF